VKITKRIMKSEKGQLFIENMVAISIIVIGLLAVLTLLSNSISFTRVVADQYIAANLATEGIEIAKNIIDANVCGGGWPALGYYDFAMDFEGNSPVNIDDPLKFDEVSNVYNYSTGENSKFRRRISGDNTSGEEAIVISTVEWTNRAGSFDIEVEDHFFNWRSGFTEIPTNCGNDVTSDPEP